MLADFVSTVIPTMHSQLRDVLANTYASRPSAWGSHEFSARHVKHPKSGEQIMLVSAPMLRAGLNGTLKAGLKDFLTHA